MCKTTFKACLENFTNKNNAKFESTDNYFKIGDHVEDIDGYKAMIIDVDSLGELWSKHCHRLCNTNYDYIKEYRDENPDWAFLDDCVIIRYDYDGDLSHGDCAIIIDPENGLEKIA